MEGIAAHRVDDEPDDLEREHSMTSSLRSSTARRRRGFMDMRERHPPTEWTQTLLDLDRMQQENKLRLQESSTRREASAMRSATSPADRLLSTSPGGGRPAPAVSARHRDPPINIYTPSSTSPKLFEGDPPEKPFRTLNLTGEGSTNVKVQPLTKLQSPVPLTAEGAGTSRPREKASERHPSPTQSPSTNPAVLAVTKAASYRTTAERANIDVPPKPSADEWRSQMPLTGPAATQSMPSTRGSGAKRSAMPLHTTPARANCASLTLHQQQRIASPRTGATARGTAKPQPASQPVLATARHHQPAPCPTAVVGSPAAASARMKRAATPSTTTTPQTQLKPRPAVVGAASPRTIPKVPEANPTPGPAARRGSTTSVPMATTLTERRRVEALKARQERERQRESVTARVAANRAAATRQQQLSVVQPRSATAARPSTGVRGVRRKSLPTEPLVKAAGPRMSGGSGGGLPSTHNAGGEELEPSSSARAVPFCTECGRRHIDERAKFCAFCGHKREIL